MQIQVVCPEHKDYEGECVFVTLPSTDGELGVLAHHASEICTVASGYVRVHDKDMATIDHVFAVDGGYTQVADDVIIVMAERSQDLSKIDKEKVKADIQGFEDTLGTLSENDARRAYLYNEIAWCKLLLAE